MRLARSIHTNCRMRVAPLADVAPEVRVAGGVNNATGESEDPDAYSALSFLSEDGADEHVFVLSASDKQRLLGQLAGGVVLPSL